MKKVGLIDVDGHNFPNLPLMKLSAWHKRKGDEVEWYEPFKGILEEYDIVYMSKVFSDEYTKDYEFPVYAKKVVKGGTGYAIKKETGIERYMVILAFVANEALSIIENAGLMGVPMPAVITKAVDMLQQDKDNKKQA